MATSERDEVLRKLRIMAGTWHGTETIQPAAWDPAGGRATVRVENRLALGDQVLIHHYEQVREDGSAFFGHGVLRWDGFLREFVFHWFDSLRTAPSEFRGTFDGGALTLSRPEPGRTRASWSFDGDRYTHRMDVSADRETWVRYLEGACTRET